MTDSEKLLAIGGFLLNEGIRVEDTYKTVLSYRTARYREADQLDLLELIQLMDRWEYFVELATVIENILYGRHDQRPPFYPLTGLRYPDIM